MFGLEMVVLDEKNLSIISTCLKRQNVKSFAMQYIRNLRSGTKGGFKEKKILDKISSASDVVVFDYGADTYSFGNKLSEPEIKDLILRINRYSPIPESDELEVKKLLINEDGKFSNEKDLIDSDEEISLKNMLRHE